MNGNEILRRMGKSERQMLLLHRVSECGSIPLERLTSGLAQELLDQGLLQFKYDHVRKRETREVELSKWGRKAVIWSVPG